MAEKRTIELEIQDNSKSLKAQYREAVQELQKVSAQYGETSEQAVKAAKAAAELKDQIGFSKDLVEAFNPDAKFKAVEGAVNGVMNGFQAFTGGMALLGVESEKVEEALLKVQSVMALTQGINGLMEARDSFKQLGIVAGNALKGIKSGLAATGIGLFVVAVGTLVAYWDDIKEAVSGVSEEQKKLNKDVDKQATASKEIYENALLQENSLRLQGKSEKEILQIRLNKYNTSIADEEARTKRLEETAKLEIEAAARNQNILKMIIRGGVELAALGTRLLVAPIDMVLKTANLVSEKLGFGTITALNLNAEITKINEMYSEVGSKFFFDPAKVQADSDATIKEAKRGLAQMKSDRDGLQLQIKQGDQQGAQDRVNTEKAAAKEQIDITRQLVDEKLRIMEDGFDKEYAILKEKKKRDKEDADKQFKEGVLKKEDYEKLLLQLDESFEADRKKLYDKSFNDNLKQKDFTVQSLIDQKKTEAEIEMAAYVEKKAVQKQRDEEEKARIEQLNKDKLKLAKDGLQLVSDLADLFGSQDEKKAKLAFQVDKAAKISSATITGYEAVLEAYKTGQKSPLTVAFPAYPYVQAGLAGAFAAVNIAKIAKSQFKASGGGGSTSSSGGGGGAGAAPMTANFNTIGSSGINQLAQLQQTPTQAYVVSGEVTSAQALDRNRVQNATL
jgi:hypothetical protein